MNNSFDDGKMMRFDFISAKKCFWGGVIACSVWSVVLIVLWFTSGAVFDRVLEPMPQWFVIPVSFIFPPFSLLGDFAVSRLYGSFAFSVLMSLLMAIATGLYYTSIFLVFKMFLNSLRKK